MARAHAVVVGSGLAGLMAAKAAAEAYERVTVFEVGAREPVVLGRSRPDAGHLQLLQPAGMAALENLDPGIALELREAGVPVIRNLDQLHMDVLGHVLCRSGALCAPIYQPATATLADRIAARLPANVEIRDRVRVVGLIGVGDRVTGVQVQTWVVESIDADLVIDASGAAAVCAGFLASAGRPAPAVERIDVDLHYASLTLQPSVEPAEPILLYCTDPYPGRPVGAHLGQIEDGRWVLSVCGYGRAQVPTDRYGLIEAARGILPAEAAKLIETATPGYQTLTTQCRSFARHRWDLAEGLPEGLVAIGEAWSSPNPTGGHGQMVAAVSALALRVALAEGDADLARRFHTGVAPAVEHAWRATLGCAWAYPEHADSLANVQNDPSLQAVLAAAEDDPEVVNLLLAMNWGMGPTGKMAQMRLMSAVNGARRSGKRDARREARVERKGARVERRQERKQSRAG